MLLHFLQRRVLFTGTILLRRPKKLLCTVESTQLVPKRNASIHTRNFLIQKVKLEHVDNFGIFLLVGGKY